MYKHAAQYYSAVSDVCNPGPFSKPQGVKLKLPVKDSRQIKVRAREDG